MIFFEPFLAILKYISIFLIECEQRWLSRSHKCAIKFIPLVPLILEITFLIFHTRFFHIAVEKKFNDYGYISVFFINKCDEIQDTDHSRHFLKIQNMNEDTRASNEETKVNFILNFSFIYFIFMVYFIKVE